MVLIRKKIRETYHVDDTNDEYDDDDDYDDDDNERR